MIRSGENFFKRETVRSMRGGDGETEIERIWRPGEEMRGSEKMFSRIVLRPGCSIGFHRHELEEEIMFVLSGRGEADDNGEIKELRPGDSMLTGGGNGHAVRCLGDEPLVLLATIIGYGD